MTRSEPLTKCQGIDCPQKGSCWRFLAPDVHPPYRQAYGNFDDVRGVRACAYRLTFPTRTTKKRRWWTRLLESV